MARRGDLSASLHCPVCGRPAEADERFCVDCRVPLVPEGDRTAVTDERHERARKIKPQLAEGPLVRVAGARNQAEGEMLQGLLLEAGVPSLLRRSAGFDVPDFLAAGPRDVLVPQSGAVTASEVLLEAEVIAPGFGGASVSPLRLAAGLLFALAIGAVIVWLVALVAH